MGTTPDLEASARIKLRRALTLSLIVVVASVVGSQNILGRVFFTAPVAADAGSASVASQGQGSNAVGGNINTFSPDDFESLIGGRYGGFDIAVLGSRGLPTNNSGVPILITEIAVRNSTDTQLRLPESMLSLQADTGEVVPIHRFDHTEHSTRLVLEPGKIETASVVVRLPPRYSANPEYYRLQVAEPNRQPLVLPLGRINEVGAESAGTITSLAEGVRTGNDVAIKLAPSSGIKVREATSSFNHRAHRAVDDHHLLMIKVDVSVGPTAAANQIADANWWTIVFDDQRLTAATVQIEGRTATDIRITAVFEAPIVATSLALATGTSASDATHRADLMVIATKTPRASSE